jgi:hypothetical protein
MKTSNFATPHIHEYFDSRGNLIEPGDELNTHINDHFKDTIVKEENGELGLILKYGEIFVPLNSLLDNFFETCEVIK